MGQQGDWLHVRLYEFDEDEEEDKDNNHDVRLVTVIIVRSTSIFLSRLHLRCVHLVTLYCVGIHLLRLGVGEAGVFKHQHAICICCTWCYCCPAFAILGMAGEEGGRPRCRVHSPIRVVRCASHPHDRAVDDPTSLYVETNCIV